jgi:hypothetical protein
MNWPMGIGPTKSPLNSLAISLRASRALGVVELCVYELWVLFLIGDPETLVGRK